MAKRVILDGEHLTLEDVHRVARMKARVTVSPEAKKKVRECWKIAAKLLAKGASVYGITTGVPGLAGPPAPDDPNGTVQKRIIFSHSANVGKPLPADIVRAAILCRANTIAKGYSAVRLKLLDSMVGLLNRDVTPLVNGKGKGSTNDDLSSLSQIADVIRGGAWTFYADRLTPGTLALKRAGVKPVDLSIREALGIINGSQMTTGQMALACHDAENVFKNAIIASTMTIEALRCNPGAFDERLHAVRPFPGQVAVAASIRTLTADSAIMPTSEENVTYDYGLRCTPQILGPSLDAFACTKRKVITEMNAAADNPLFFTGNGEFVNGGNFHGQPIGMAADFLTIALAEAASLSERHTNRLLKPSPCGLPDFLANGREPGAGLRFAQHTAAALVSENRVLSHPGVVDSISVSADLGDYVNMGQISVRKLGSVLENTITVIAIEMMAAAQALDFRKPKKPGRGTRAAYRRIRKAVDHFDGDRPLHIDIAGILELVRGGEVVGSVERATGRIDLGDYSR